VAVWVESRSKGVRKSGIVFCAKTKMGKNAISKKVKKWLFKKTVILFLF
jgi:hypothetical protein